MLIFYNSKHNKLKLREKKKKKVVIINNIKIYYCNNNLSLDKKLIRKELNEYKLNLKLTEE